MQEEIERERKGVGDRRTSVKHNCEQWGLEE